MDAEVRLTGKKVAESRKGEWGGTNVKKSIMTHMHAETKMKPLTVYANLKHNHFFWSINFMPSLPKRSSTPKPFTLYENRENPCERTHVELPILHDMARTGPKQLLVQCPSILHFLQHLPFILELVSVEPTNLKLYWKTKWTYINSKLLTHWKHTPMTLSLTKTKVLSYILESIFQCYSSEILQSTHKHVTNYINYSYLKTVKIFNTIY